MEKWIKTLKTQEKENKIQVKEYNVGNKIR